MSAGAIQRHSTNGAFKRNTTHGSLRRNTATVTACCCTATCSSPLACPSGTASSYTVTVPTSLTFGTCTDWSTGTGTTSPTTHTVTGSCGSGFGSGWFTGVIANGNTGGHTWPTGGSNNPTLQVILRNVCISSVPYWELVVFIRQTGIVGGGHNTDWTYRKVRSGATVNDIAGTYNFVMIVDETNTICVGATTDATLTVS